MDVSLINFNKTLECVCQNHCPENKPNGTCLTVGDGRCFAQIEETSLNSDHVKITKGCTPPETGSVFQCKAKKHFLRKSIECCDRNMCNIDLSPKLPPKEFKPASDLSATPGSVLYTTAIVCTVLLSTAIILSAIITLYLSWRKRKLAKKVNLILNHA